MFLSNKFEDEQDLSFFGLWEEKHNLMVTKELSLIEKYLNSPHFLFEIKNNNNSSTEHIVLIMNIIVQNFVDKDFLGYFILPVTLFFYLLNLYNYSKVFKNYIKLIRCAKEKI